jgi:hypothetical protein
MAPHRNCLVLKRFHAIQNQTPPESYGSIIHPVCYLCKFSIAELQKRYDLNHWQQGGGMVCRHFDGTPIYLRFGELQSTVARQARYLKEVQREDPFTGITYPAWTTISFKQYMQENPKAACSAGVLDIHGQHGRKVFLKAVPLGICHWTHNPAFMT